MAHTRPRIGHRKRLGAAVLGTVALIVLAGTTSASAQRWVGHDRAHDVVRSWQDPEPEPCGTPRSSTRPGNTHHDIRRVVVDHRRRTVEIKVFFENLRPRGGHITSLGIRTDGPGYLVDARRSGWSVYREPSDYDTDECGLTPFVMFGEPCRGFETLDAPWRDLVLFSIPRACLGHPDWVSVSASSYRIVSRTALVGDQWGAHDEENPFGPYGPRVKRGSRP